MSLFFNEHRSGAADVAFLQPPDLLPSSDSGWLQSLTSSTPRPHILVLCQDVDTESVVYSLMQKCPTPLRLGLLPGALALPSRKGGTLLLGDVAALTLGQQIELFDWMGDHPGTTQVIAVTSAPLLSLVEDGRFLEGLFYRLNSVYVIATREHVAYSLCRVVESVSRVE